MRTSSLFKTLGVTGLPKSAQSDRPQETGNKKLDRLSTALWMAEQGKDWYDKAKNVYSAYTTWTVSIDEMDAGYLIVQQWLFERLPQTKQKNVRATTKTVFLNTDGTENTSSGLFDDFMESRSGASKTSETRVAISLNETQDQKIMVDGHKIQVRVTNKKNEEELSDLTRPRRSSSSIKSGRIVFTCRSIEAQNAVIALLNRLIGGKNKRKPALWIADSWGSWRQQDAPIRKLDSVILAKGVKEDIMGDVQKFLDDENKYNDLGIPWHRGYLFHGPAGTGKTSLIKALAADLGLDLWYAPLGDLKEDSSLVDLIRSVSPRGILLLEDVDSYSAARDRNDEAGDAGFGVTTSALLNALDGVVTPHGLITIMTTNHLEKLDPALIRSGRADRSIKLDLPGWEEVGRLWNLFFPEAGDLGDEPARFASSDISQAIVSEVFKRNWDEPDAARLELIRTVNECSNSIVS